MYLYYIHIEENFNTIIIFIMDNFFYFDIYFFMWHFLNGHIFLRKFFGQTRYYLQCLQICKNNTLFSNLLQIKIN